MLVRDHGLRQVGTVRADARPNWLEQPTRMTRKTCRPTDDLSSGVIYKCSGPADARCSGLVVASAAAIWLCEARGNEPVLISPYAYATLTRST